MADKNFSVIEKPLPRIDSENRVKGDSRYADDLVFPRMIYAKIHSSRHPHAQLKAVDFQAALSAPGVVAVIGGNDFSHSYGILPVSQDERPLAVDRVRYVGEPIVAVAALSEAEAEGAARLVRVEYGPLDRVMGIPDGLNPALTVIHPGSKSPANIHKQVGFEFGESDLGVARGEFVEEGLYFYGGNTHLAMEQHCAIGIPLSHGRIEVHSSTQVPHYLQKALARVLDMPPARIRVVAIPNGGGFGGKSDIFPHEFIVARLALKTGRPVKLTLTREEVFHCHRGRHPVLMRLRSGFTRDGLITGMQLDTILDGGAFGSYGVASTLYTGALQTVTYHVPNYRFRGVRVFTNKAPCGPKRGHGTPQPRFALEVMLDRAAHRLGINPADLRLRQLTRPGEITVNGMRVVTTGLRSCLEEVVKRSDFRSRHGRMAENEGLGLAVGAYISGAGLPIYWNEMPQSAAQIKVDRGGGVTIFCGSTDIGQGSDNVLAAVVAEILGLTPFEIRVITGDTDLTPVDLGSYSSRVTLMSGHAASDAAIKIRDMIKESVAGRLKCPPENVMFRAGRIFDSRDGGEGISFVEGVVLAETARGTLGAVGWYKAPKPAATYKGGGVGPTPTYSYSAAVVHLRVDPLTFQPRVLKVWLAHDIGRSINPLQVRSQVEGSVYMGLGEALLEEIIYRRGLPRAPSMLDYKSPTMLEMPPVETILINTNDPEGPFGAKECGQGPLLPIPPAVANAVFDAIKVRIDEVPITPDKIMAALEDKKRGGQGRHGPKIFPAIPDITPYRVDEFLRSPPARE